MCNFGGIPVLGQILGTPDPSKEMRKAEERRAAEAEALRKEEEAKRKKRRAQRVPTETIIAGETGGDQTLAQ